MAVCFFRFRVSDRIVDLLLASGYVVGTPEWRYTDMKRLCASELGQHQLWHERAIVREAQATAPPLSHESHERP